MEQLRPLRETLEDVINPSHTALLVIDVQNDFRTPEWNTMLPRLKRVIETARTVGVFVIYVQNVVLPNDLSNSVTEIARRRKHGMRSEVTVDNTPGQLIVEDIAPKPGEPIIRKHRMNSFLGTSLDLLLRNHRIETLVCVGVATHGCVMNTAYSGIMSDYYIVVVDDCVSAGKPDLHEAALFLMKNSMHYVVDSSRLISAWGV